MSLALPVKVLKWAVVLCCSIGSVDPLRAAPFHLESPALLVEIDETTGAWSLLDKRANLRWPSSGQASPGVSSNGSDGLRAANVSAELVQLQADSETSVTFALVDEGRTLELSFQTPHRNQLNVLGDLLTVTNQESGYAIVPCREGLLIPADSGIAFQQAFGTSDYEGCHMNMLGFVKTGAAMIVSWDDAYTWVELASRLTPEEPSGQCLTATFTLRKSARSIRLTPIGHGDWNSIAEAYRKIVERKGQVTTLGEKTLRNPHAERLIGAANVKLWTCLARRMNEASTQEESVTVRWTFDEAASIAEHLRSDLEIDRCLFILGGWTEGGYDCRHPDNLPANSECGGNDALASAIERIQRLNYVACLHDNYQDMYRDAKSWDPPAIEKSPDGSLIQGGRWLGGRAFMVCAPKQYEYAMRAENLPAVQQLFRPWSYFIDTTYAVGPRECADPHHPLGRNDDIAWKIRLSDRARDLFGLFGSECGREWALPHSDFFEGIVGVSGRHFHNLDPQAIGAIPIPFWEMVYHDCQICYGKYGYRADQAAPYVAHHVLCARPLHYHSVPDHRYWLEPANGRDRQRAAADPADVNVVRYDRTDSGWAQGLHPHDAFLKNTHEVLGPLHQATANQRLVRFEFLTPDKTLRRAVYGNGREQLTVVVNYGEQPQPTSTRYGGDVLLPAWGFVVEGPHVAGFCATSWNGHNYSEPALFTIQALNGENFDTATQLRVFHGFGSKTLAWRSTVHEIEREQVVSLRDVRR